MMASRLVSGDEVDDDDDDDDDDEEDEDVCAGLVSAAAAAAVHFGGDGVALGCEGAAQVAACDCD